MNHQQGREQNEDMYYRNSLLGRHKSKRYR